MLSSKTTTPLPDNNRKAAVIEQDPQQQPPLKCPRCDSSNTKFCYYNNYSLSQPRHFCKTCRRYWTRGGSLRNVPIGGDCRKTKKLKTSNISSSSNPVAPAAGVYTQSSTQFATSRSGHGFGLNFSNLGGATTPTTSKISISSIESLSSINQEMHWKLQQQRMALIYQGDHDHTHDDDGNNKEKEEQGCINLFQSLEFSGKAEVGPRDWSFEIQPTNYAINSSTTTYVNHVNNNSDRPTANFTTLQQDQHVAGADAWTDLHQFSGGV